MTHPDVQRFRLTKIAQVLGMSPNIVHNWMHSPKGVFTLSDDDERAVGSGGTYRLTFESAMRIAILRILSNHGLAPDKGFDVVMTYMETGGTTYWNGEAFEREPGQDFPGDDVHTLVVLEKDRAELRPARPTEAWAGVIGDGALGVAVLNITMLRRFLEHALSDKSEDDADN